MSTRCRFQASRFLLTLLPILFAVAAACVSPEDGAFYAAFDKVIVGASEEDVRKLLGPPDDSGETFRLGQPEGFERQYREAAQSGSVRYLFWYRGIDVVCTIGFGKEGRVAYTACGGT